MTITKTRTHHINMGPYESLTLSATVAWDTEGHREGVGGEALDQIDALLAEALEADIKQAKELAIEDSYIHDWTESK